MQCCTCCCPSSYPPPHPVHSFAQGMASEQHTRTHTHTHIHTHAHTHTHTDAFYMPAPPADKGQAGPVSEAYEGGSSGSADAAWAGGVEGAAWRAGSRSGMRAGMVQLRVPSFYAGPSREQRCVWRAESSAWWVRPGGLLLQGGCVQGAQGVWCTLWWVRPGELLLQGGCVQGVQGVWCTLVGAGGSAAAGGGGAGAQRAWCLHQVCALSSNLQPASPKCNPD